MNSSAELNALREHIRRRGIRNSAPRDNVIRVFLSTERHLSIQQLYDLVKRKYPAVGIATVYRAMKTACEAGLAREIEIDGSDTRYEHLLGHEHHDHIVCVKCGTLNEFYSPAIEKEQELTARKHGFTLIRHRHTLYGLCQACKAG